MAKDAIPETKAVPGTRFCVDGPYCQAEKYFVTHAHCDHYRGLSDTWDRGPLYCSECTAQVLLAKFPGLQDMHVLRPLPMRKAVEIGEVLVTLVDANHCPGAVQMIFKLKDGRCYLHTGDMRYHPKFMEDSLIKQCRGATVLYLDTTYCNPKYVFPSQKESVSYVVDTIVTEMQLESVQDVDDSQKSENNFDKPLFLISTYSIGKEKILKAVAKKCKCKLYVSPHKMNILTSIGDDELTELLTDNPLETSVHVCRWGTLGNTWPYFQPNFEKMEEYRREHKCSKVIGFVPTGWMYEMKKEMFRKKEKGRCQVHLVPYSEHSNFEELREYVQFLRPEHVIPTVGVSEDDVGKKSSSKMTNYFSNLMNETASKQRFINNLSKSKMQSPSNIIGLDALSNPPDNLCSTSPKDLTSKTLVAEQAPPCSDKRHDIQASNSEDTGNIQVDAESKLLSVIPDLTLDAAREFLKRSNNDIQNAINIYFDGCSSSLPSLSKGPSADIRNAVQSERPPKRHKTKVQRIDAIFRNKNSEIIGKACLEEGVSKSPNGSSGITLGNSANLKPVNRAADSVESAPFKANVARCTDEYNPTEESPWSLGEECPYLHLATTFDLLEKTTKRLKISDLLTNMFRSIFALSPHNLLGAVYLTCGKIAPDYLNEELNIGGSTVANAISEATGVTRSRMSELYKKMGDIGDIAQVCKSNQRTLLQPKPLLLSDVFRTLKSISMEQGKGSSNRKKNLILKLLRACRGPEIKYLTRTLVQNLRIGASRISVLSALGRAAAYHFHDKPSKEVQSSTSEFFCKTYCICPNFDIIINALLQGGLEHMKSTCCLTPGVPLKPMLAKTANGIEDAIKLMDKGLSFLAEYKYDGQRAQIHKLDGSAVKIFSRNCEDRTNSFPDAVEIVCDALPESCGRVVIDAEIVGIDRISGELRAFQDLSTRARGEVDKGATKIDVCIFVFDILYLDDAPLIDMTLEERRGKLIGVLKEKKGFIEMAKSSTITKEDKEGIQDLIRQKLASSWDDRCEGLMFKSLPSTYAPDHRSDNWLKLKKDYCEDLQDSVDLVPIGAWYGNGRKAGWYSPFLLAAWNPDLEQYESVCRCLSGFSDAFYKESKEYYSANLLESKPSYYCTAESASVWFQPNEVWEIRGADFTISPVHQAAAGLVDSVKGVSMRFPRFIRKRPDKGIEEATSSKEIAEMYLKQNRKRMQ